MIRIASLATLTCLASWSLSGTAWADPPNPLWTEKASAAGLSSDDPVSMGAFAQLAKRLSPSVINIHVQKASRGGRRPMSPFFGGPRRPEGFSEGLGTGFIIHADGYALTNNHVVEGATVIEVQLANEQTYKAEIVGTYPELDVALIHFKPDRPLTPAPLGDSGSLQIGEWVIAIGNPFGLNHTVTAGIVSAKGRRDVHPGHRPIYSNFIQTDASINPGNSGGPLINIRGEVIGINTAINSAGQGIGFAVPVNMVKTILPELARGRVKRSYLGVRIGPVNRALAEQMKMEKPQGALVREVLRGGAADLAGIQPGDVILSWNDRPLDHWEDLSWVASTSGTAKRITLLVRRGSQDVTLYARLKAHPDDKSARSRRSSAKATAPKSHALEDLGVKVSVLGKREMKSLRLRPKMGVVVESVDRGSAAQFAGLERGDVIVRVNNRPIVNGLTDFNKRVRSVKRGQVLSLLVRRGDRTIYLAFTR